MATKLSELRDKLEGLTRSTDPASEYQKTLAQVKAAEAEIETTRKSAADKLEAEKARKDAKEKKSDLELIQTLETYIQRRKDLGDTVPERIQTQYNNLKKKYPTETSQASGGNESGYYSGSTFVPGKQSAPTPTAETPSAVKTPSKKTPAKQKQTPVLTDAEQRAQALETAGTEDFALPETIFNNVPSLKAILDRYVKEDWTESKLRKAIRDDVWYRQNSGAIKQRYVQLFNYRDLVNTGRAQGTTQYEQDIEKLERQLADKARQVGSGIASDPAALRKAAENMYITNVGIDDAMTTDFIAAAIRPIGSTIAGQGTSGYSGQALKDYQEIQGVARANGFRVKDIVPGGQTEQQVLQGIATGRIDPNRLAQDARKLAAQGQPQYVRDLLGQGYNLDQVFAPYRQTMANLLEINADEIDLNDSTLRSAITDKGDMNIYDFKKTLKADKRWQYTENAKQEVSDVALQVLRDFGFQG